MTLDFCKFKRTENSLDTDSDIWYGIIMTNIVFILDRSGSMASVWSDVKGSYNSFIKKQQEIKDDVAKLTLVAFDDNIEIAYDDVDVQFISPDLPDTIGPRGWTALLDAVGISITNLQKKLGTSKDSKDKVLFVIQTDGQENSSKEYSFDTVRALVEKTTKENKWDYMFLGANMDAFDLSSKLGVLRANTVSYSSVKTKGAFDMVGDKIASYRTSSWDDKDQTVAFTGAERDKVI